MQLNNDYFNSHVTKIDCANYYFGVPYDIILRILPFHLQFWFSWRHQIREFSTDYHVVAVDLRGYGETDRPPQTLDYVLTNLCQDIVELIPALGHSKAILVAHDWGAGIAWTVTQRHPQLVQRLVVMNCPHPNIFKQVIIGTMAQLLKSWYMFLFQLPWLPEFILSRRDFGYFNAIFHGKKAGVRNKAAFPSEVLDAYKYVFSQPGATTGPINYIRCIFKQFPAGDEARIAERIIHVPTLIIWGDDDLFLESAMADAHNELVRDLTVRHIPKCSHWVQQDQPALVNQYIRDFI